MIFFNITNIYLRRSTRTSSVLCKYLFVNSPKAAVGISKFRFPAGRLFDPLKVRHRANFESIFFILWKKVGYIKKNSLLVQTHYNCWRSRNVGSLILSIFRIRILNHAPWPCINVWREIHDIKGGPLSIDPYIPGGAPSLSIRGGPLLIDPYILRGGPLSIDLIPQN